MNPLAGVSLDELRDEHLAQLVVDAVEESLTLDFKRDPWDDDGRGKNELLKDVSALANAIGGDIVVGVEDKDDRAVAFRQIASASSLVERIQKTCSDGIRPRLDRLHVRAVPLPGGGEGLVIRVPPGIRPPYCVVRDNRCQVFRRYRPHESRAATPEEIREMVLRSEGLATQAKDLFAARRAHQEGLQRCGLSFYAAPLVAAEDLIAVESKDLRERLRWLDDQPRRPQRSFDFGQPADLTLEGLINAHLARDDAYPLLSVELWRTGYVELWRDAHAYSMPRPENKPAGPPAIGVLTLGEVAMAFCRLLCDLHLTFGLPTPIAVGARLVQANALGILNGTRSSEAYAFFEAITTRREMLETPPRVWYDLDQPDPIAEELTRRLLNGYGIERALGFETGRWAPPRR